MNIWRKIKVVWVLLLCASLQSACAKAVPAEDVREPVLAGSWYSGTEGGLRKQVDGFLEKASRKELKGKIIALISPHAGYEYSGQCAAYGYSLLKEGDFDRVIVLAISHRGFYRGASILRVSHYKTPLGLIEVDRGACDALLKENLFQTIPRAHLEHSLEIQLPFLQRTLKKFKLIPILIGRLDLEDYDAIANAVKKYVNGRTLLVASSDFTHWGARFDYWPFRDNVKENLRKLDMGAVERILALDFDGFVAYKRETHVTICGFGPIGILLKILPKDAKGELLKYYTSADLGDTDSSVSYVSIVFTTGESAPVNIPDKQKAGKTKSEAKAQRDEKPTPKEEPETKESKTEGAGYLTKEEKQTLLALARDTLESYIKYKKTPNVGSGKYKLTPKLMGKGAAFVTLNKNGNLRGCIGHIRAVEPLYKSIIGNAISASTRDYRFRRVREDELDDIEIEISVLTPLEKVDGPEDIVIGKHGVILKKGFAQAVYLPQVAPEQGWGREEMLKHLSVKAGLLPDAWEKGCEFYVFEAEVFHEGGEE